MHILAGAFKGQRVSALPAVRMTSEKVKAALFNILGEAVPGARFLDVCAGSGSVGLEALSRGAASAAWIERDRSGARLLRENVTRIAGPAAAKEVLCGDAPAGLRRLAARGSQFDLIFLDPPYRDISLLKRALQAIIEHAILAPAGWLVVEHDRRTEIPQPIVNLQVTERYRYGDTELSLCRLAGGG